MQLFSRLRTLMTCRPHARRAPAPPPRFRPRLEALEARVVPSFAAPVAYPVSQPVAMVTADVNGDGKPDLITLAGGGAYVSVQLNNGNGTFGAARQFYDGGHMAAALAVGDVNGDGKPDLVLANVYDGGPVPAGTYTGSVTVLLGDGKGGFTPAAVSNGRLQYETIFPGSVTSIALADFYGDGRMALAATPASGGVVYVARSDAYGNFAKAQSYRVPGEVIPAVHAQVAAGDLNGDDKPDVVVTDPHLNAVSVLLNNGHGAFGAALTYAVGGAPTSVAVGDVSGDGKLDIVTANSNGTASVLLNTGAGAFGAAQNYALGGSATSVALGDFNHDGRLDIATTGGAETDVLFNKGNGAFAAYQKVGPAGGAVAAADLNGDGYPDLTEVAASNNSIDVLMNQADW